MEAGTSLDDDYLVARAQEGYVDAYTELVSRHAPQVYRVALRMLGNPYDAEDITQDSLITAWQRLPGFRRDAQFSTWLYRIVTRRCLNRLQRSTAHDSLDLLADLPDNTDEPARQVERQGANDAVTAAVTGLPPAQRAVVTLHHLEGLSYADTAQVLGTSEASVRNHLFRARRTLGTQLMDWR